MTARAPLSSPGVPFPPPFLFVGGYGVGWLIDRFLLPMGVPGIHPRYAEMIGVVFMVIGLVLGGWGILTFRLARTAIIPNQPATRLVGSGPYRFTRNPMYTGLTALYIGISLATNNLWPIILLPSVLVVLDRLVVRREEAYLADAFGASYEAYRQRVPRWM
jgi:protein-S-isoprenylcysteine O-methyltransferase Ste14